MKVKDAQKVQKVQKVQEVHVMREVQEKKKVQKVQLVQHKEKVQQAHFYDEEHTGAQERIIQIGHKVDLMREKLHIAFEANNDTTFAERLLQAHKCFAHINWAYLRKILGLPSTGNNPRCDSCDVAKMHQQGLPPESYKRSTRILHRLHLDLAFNSKGDPVQVVVDDYTRRSWLQHLVSKDEVFAKFLLLKAVLEKDKSPWRVAIIRIDRQSIYISITWTQHRESPDTAMVHEVSAPYKKGQNGVVERHIQTLGHLAKP